MYFRIPKGTETFNKLQALHQLIEKARASARKLVKTFGGTGEYCGEQQSIGGGIAGVEFKEKPEGWKMVGEKYQKLFMPKADQKELWKKIKALPVIEYDELNKIVGFDGPQTAIDSRGIAWINSVGMVWGTQYMLMEVAKGCKFKPNKDMTEIVESEYQKLEKYELGKRKG